MKRRFFPGYTVLLACFLLFVPQVPAQEDITRAANTETAELDGIMQPDSFPEEYEPEEYFSDEFTPNDLIVEDNSSLREEQILELDIKTSSLMELASWARSLGLSEGGTRDDLANRLRSYYNLPSQGGTVSEERKTIIIESARTTEYFTLEIVDEEYARLRGDVVISLKDGDAVHRISAWEILYNRTRNIMTASGGVVYIKEEGTTVETFKGESITVNLDNWSSIFLDGVSERAISGGATAYRFSGTVISRNSEEVTVLTGAEITNGQNEEALWSLNASKLWLLPGSDWAILNAVLKVGHIPVLWLPFFYYPSDEIVFHPVMGTRAREGVFLQTTTYILGRPITSTTLENSITKIFGSAPDGEKVQEGLFLRATGKKTVSADTPRLSLLFDAYTNLGYYLGTDFYLPRNGNFGAFNMSLGLGFTRNIYQVDYGSSPFAKYDGTSEWNSSYFFTFKVPFRFRMDMTGSYTIGYGSLSWNIPLYSDPYVNRDFKNRSEVLDWLAMLREGASASTEQTSDTYLSSYEMRLSGSFSPQISGLAPYISSLSFSSISSSLSFATGYTNPYNTSPPPAASQSNPDRMFFYPNKFVLLSVSASMGGTPYTNVQSSSAAARTVLPDLDSLLPGLPVSPWEEPENPELPALSVNDPYSLDPPVLSQRFDLSAPGSPRLTFNYTFSPSAASELQFYNNAWRKAEDINWGETSSVLTRVRGDLSLGLTLNQTGGSAYSGSFRLTGTGSWQDYNYLNEDAVTEIGASRRRAYNETFITTSYNLSASVRPFYQNTVWSNTSISYDIRGLLAKTVFDGTNVTDILNKPEWNWEFGEWTKEKLETHTLSTRLEASVMDYIQSISVSAVLPPKSSSLTGNAIFRAWISETRVRNTITEPFDDLKRVIQPIYFTESLKFNNWISFDQSLTYDPEIKEWISLTSSLNLWRFTARYQMSYISPYYLNYNRLLDPLKPAGWIQMGDKNFEPQELSFSFSNSFPKRALWNNGPFLTFNIGSSLIFDLQRYTYSRLTFSLGLGLEISKFMEIQFSTSSENAQMYRYFKDSFFFKTSVPLPAEAETNFFVDLLNSFRFDNDELRRHSAFKLKTFKLDVVHYLGDWTATLGIALSPYLDQTTSVPSWKFNNEISFMVKWIPIEEIRTEIGMDKDRMTFR